MRRPRVRVSVRGMMVVVGVVALIAAWAIRRPYPCAVAVLTVAPCHVLWSDGSATLTDQPPILRGNSWLLIVDWDDGSTGYYLRVPRPARPRASGPHLKRAYHTKK